MTQFFEEGSGEARLFSRRTFLRAVGGGGVTASFAGCIGLGPSREERLSEIRDVLDPYRDVTVAINEEYRMAATYVRKSGGGLGIPFLGRGAGKLAENQPSVLYYDLMEDGTYDLLGAEWAVAVEETDSPPTLFGQEFHKPMEGHAPLQRRHYGLHVWPFHDETDRAFATYHPDVTPPPFIDSLREVWRAIGDLRLGSEATKKGYTNTEKCIANSNGLYGVPFVDNDAEALNLKRPPILLYRLTQNWNYELMGAEWYVPVSETDSTPTLFGKAFHEPMKGHSPKTEQPRHYGLHAWLFRANPTGMFVPFNPAIRC